MLRKYIIFIAKIGAGGCAEGWESTRCSRQDRDWGRIDEGDGLAEEKGHLLLL